jgi:excisionase family DNA binding protein
MVTNDRPLTIRIEAAAQILGISRAQAYAMTATGELPSILIRRSRRVPVRQLEEWVEQHVTGGSPMPPSQADAQTATTTVAVEPSESEEH